MMFRRKLLLLQIRFYQAFFPGDSSLSSNNSVKFECRDCINRTQMNKVPSINSIWTIFLLQGRLHVALIYKPSSSYILNKFLLLSLTETVLNWYLIL